MLDDGATQFIPGTGNKTPTAKASSFAHGGHPPFDYESVATTNVLTSGTLNFNHKLHMRSHLKFPSSQEGVPAKEMPSLTCASCHKPSPDGVYTERPTYANSCKQCHSLQFDPDASELEIPHRDADKVRAFLHSLTYQYFLLAAERFKNNDKYAYTWWQEKLNTLRSRVKAGEDFEKQVFDNKNPFRISGIAGNKDTSGLFPGCAYCHKVVEDSKGLAQIVKPVVVDRWLKFGRFTHASHTHMDCEECHNAEESTDSGDIMLPADLPMLPKQAKCAECHGGSDQLVAASKRSGARTDCLACHRFHSPHLKDRSIQSAAIKTANQTAAPSSVIP